METVKWNPKIESIKDTRWDTKQILPCELMKCIISILPNKTAWDPKSKQLRTIDGIQNKYCTMES